jgi:hypothetical protein
MLIVNCPAPSRPRSCHLATLDQMHLWPRLPIRRLTLEGAGNKAPVSDQDLFLARQVARRVLARRDFRLSAWCSRENHMNVYLYKAALWCGPCIIKTLVAERKAAPGAVDMLPAVALEQIVSVNAFTDESDYDCDDLPKGPYADGGGEADTPQHCDGCGQFLGNPLTGDGLVYVEHAIRASLTNKRLTGVTSDAVVDWAEFYKDELDFRRIVLAALKK